MKYNRDFILVALIVLECCTLLEIKNIGFDVRVKNNFWIEYIWQRWMTVQSSCTHDTIDIHRRLKKST